MKQWRKGLLFLSLAVVGLLWFQGKMVPEAFAPESLNEQPLVSEADKSLEIESTDGAVIAEIGTTLKAASEQRANNEIDVLSASAYTLDFDVSINEWMADYREAVRDSTPDDYELKRQQAEEMDADAAYWLYEFYRVCENAPRADWQLEKVLSRAERRVDYAKSDGGSSRRLDRVQRMLDWYVGSYELCSFLGPEFDTRSESLAWLETAADLGHMGALRLYHSQARELLTGNDSNLVFHKPDLLYAFKMNSQKYARELLKTDHPQGYLLMARMYFVGDVYDQDFVKAYAYARAAYLVGTAGAQSDAQSWINVISSNLPPLDIPDAEGLAQELLGNL